MQELMVPAQSTSPYTPVGGGNMPNAPQLGTPVPGTTGGLPALSGLSVNQNPMAKQLQSMGRGEDSMLVHMTPNEVNSLRGLAQQFGGDLSVNPNTGLPEAGWLGKLLPTILGIAGAAFGIPTWALALGGTAAGTAVTGDLSKGLMAGLGAWGGASLAGGLGLGKAGEAAVKAAQVGTDAATQLSMSPTLSQPITGVASGAAPSLSLTAPTGVIAEGGRQAIQSVAPQLAAQNMAQVAAQNAARGGLGGGFLDKFAATAREGMPGGIIGKYAPYAAGLGVLSSVSDALQPELPKYKPEETKPYTPMAPGRRDVRFQTPEQMRESGGAEFSYFTPTNPEPVPVSSLDIDERIKYGYADGGSVDEGDGGLAALIASYQAQNPGAITASMRPTPSAPPTLAAPAAPAAGTGLGSYTTTPSQTGGETQYNFARTPNIGAGAGTGFAPGQAISIPGFGSFQLPDFSGMDFSQFMPQSQTPAPQTPATQPAAPADIMNRFAELGFNNPQSISSPMYRNPMVADAIARSQAAAPATPAAPVAPTPSPSQFTPGPMASIPGVGNIQLPDFSEMDFSQFAPQVPEETTPTYDIMTPGQYGRPNVARDMYAGGGTVNMRDGSFVVDARTVSELGNGSSNAGMEMLSRMGGRPVRGPGDGVSDSVRASIGGKQEARVARDEVIFPPEAVRRIGGGSDKRGTQKLYAMMDKAHKARKKAKRGQDTGLRRGLA